jgi:N-hydroxyarylamine O-acetyltransferase
MHVNEVSRPGAFMKVVDVLGDQNQIVAERLLKFCKGVVSGVGFNLAQLRAAGVVETVYEFRVGGERFGSRQPCGIVFGPDALRIAERRKATLGGNSRPGENDRFHSNHSGVLTGWVHGSILSGNMVSLHGIKRSSRFPDCRETVNRGLYVPATTGYRQAGMEIERYFERIGLAGCDSDTEGLRAVQSAQMRSITFENIVTFLGDVPDIAPEAIFRKLVVDDRGGYCFELNSLFGAALDAIGFKASRVLARVRNGAVRGGARTHLAWVVTIAGEEWLADTGFGGPGAAAPLLMGTAQAQQTPSGRYRLREDEIAGENVVERETANGWFALYGFDRAPVADADIDAANFLCARWEKAPFPSNFMASRHTADGRVNILNRTLRVERAGETSSQKLGTQAELYDVLAGEFGLAYPRETASAIWERLNGREPVRRQD